MDKLQIFNNPQFGNIRCIEIDGEPWMVLKDVCEAFGETNYRRVAARLDQEEKGVSQISTPGGPQNMTVVNESGLYSALFTMQPEKARGVSNEYVSERRKVLEVFTRWVTGEVLPSIRRTGGYMLDTPEMSDEEIMARALLVANDTIKRKDGRIKALEAKPEADTFANIDTPRRRR